MVQVLMDKGADLNVRGNRNCIALHAASMEGHQDVVRMLLDKGADPNPPGNSPGKARRKAKGELTNLG